MKKGFKTISSILALVLLTTSLLAGCTNGPSISTATPTGTSETVPTLTTAPTETPVPTSTPTPTPEPTATPTPEPTATPVPLSTGLQPLDKSLFDYDNHSFLNINTYDYDSNGIFSLDGKYLFTCVENEIFEKTVETGETRKIDLNAKLIPSSVYDTYHNRAGDLCLLISGYGGDFKHYYLGYNLEKNVSEIMMPSEGNSFSVMQDVLFCFHSDTRTYIYDFYPNDASVRVSYPGFYDANFLLVDKKYILCVQYQDNYDAVADGKDSYFDEYGYWIGPVIVNLGLFDLTDGTFVATTTINLDNYRGHECIPYFADEDTIYLDFLEEDKDSFFSWDYLNDVPGSNDFRFMLVCKTPDVDYYSDYPIETGRDFSEIKKGPVIDSLKDLDKIATELEQKYDVEIYLSNEVVGYVGSYFCEAENNHETTKKALELLSHGLAKYPDGFFTQLKSEATGYTKGVCFYLAGTLRGMESNTLSTAGGFKYCDGDRIKIYMDINDMSDDSTIHHELSHAIDSQLEALGLGISDNDWNKFNPSTPFHESPYTYSYDTWGFDDFEDCVMYWYEDKTRTYFIDKYSMTYPTEDRARLMENVMREDGWVDYNEYPNLKKKLNYFAMRIRQGFDTTGWPEKTYWEKYTE